MIEVVEGSGPIVLGLPHTGTDVPADVWDRLNDRGRELADTDWYIHQLYDGLLDDVTTVRTPVHRYVIDVNRDPAGESLYPGQNTTGLCPLTDFDGQAIYRDGAEPTAAAVALRCVEYHTPYHVALTEQMKRVQAKHGCAVLYDCHSIRSQIPFLFDGTLPDFCIGTNMGATCAPGVEGAVRSICEAAEGYTSVLNGRFKGGWTTRHYGRPDEGWHAIQMELAQSTYLSAEYAPWTYDDAKAGRLRAHLGRVLQTLDALVRDGAL